MDDTPSLAALQSPPALTSILCILKYNILSISHAQSWLRVTARKLLGLFTLQFAAGSIDFHGAVQKTRGEICCCWKSQ